MSDTVQVALIATIVPSLIALLGFLQGLSNGKKAKNIDEKATKIEEKVDKEAVKTAEIHTLANSNLAKVTEQNNVLTAKLEELNKKVAMMMSDKKIADDLASSKLTRKSEIPLTRKDDLHPQLTNVDIVPSSEEPKK